MTYKRRTVGLVSVSRSSFPWTYGPRSRVIRRHVTSVNTIYTEVAGGPHLPLPSLNSYEQLGTKSFPYSNYFFPFLAKQTRRSICKPSDSTKLLGDQSGKTRVLLACLLAHNYSDSWEKFFFFHKSNESFQSSCRCYPPLYRCFNVNFAFCFFIYFFIYSFLF